MKKVIIESHILDLHFEALKASKKALQKFLDDWNKKTGGNEYGEPTYCGFAGVVIYDVRSNSKLGKQLKEIGFRKHYPTGLYLNDPANIMVNQWIVKKRVLQHMPKFLEKLVVLKLT